MILLVVLRFRCLPWPPDAINLAAYVGHIGTRPGHRGSSDITPTPSNLQHLTRGFGWHRSQASPASYRNPARSADVCYSILAPSKRLCTFPSKNVENSLLSSHVNLPSRRPSPSPSPSGTQTYSTWVDTKDDTEGQAVVSEQLQTPSLKRGANGATEEVVALNYFCTIRRGGNQRSTLGRREGASPQNIHDRTRAKGSLRRLSRIDYSVIMSEQKTLKSSVPTNPTAGVRMARPM